MKRGTRAVVFDFTHNDSAYSDEKQSYFQTLHNTELPMTSVSGIQQVSGRYMTYALRKDFQQDAVNELVPFLGSLRSPITMQREGGAYRNRPTSIC